MTEWFRVQPDGLVAVRLDPLGAAALRVVARDVRQVIEVGASPTTPVDDPIRSRLFPRAYSDPTEDTAEFDWQLGVHSDLVAGKLAHLDVLTATLARAEERRGVTEVVLDPAEVDAWIGAINDARLVLGVQLGVGEGIDLDDVAVNDPRRPAVDLYEILSHSQHMLVFAILGGDPES